MFRKTERSTVRVEVHNLPDELKHALESLKGELGAFRIDPHNPASIEAAILRADTMVDERLGAHAAADPRIAAVVEEIKAKIRESLFHRAR